MARYGIRALITSAAFAAACASSAATAAGLAPEPAFSFDSSPGRLPKNVVPERYEVAVTPDLKAMTLTGRESVTLQVRSSTDRLVFNSLNETLSDVRFDGKRRPPSPRMMGSS